MNLSTIQVNSVNEQASPTKDQYNQENSELVQLLHTNNNNKELGNELKKLLEVIQEDEQILDYFYLSCGKVKTIKDLKAFLEALFFEQKIRIKEKRKIIKTVNSHLLDKNSEIKQLEIKIKKLESDLKLFKQLFEAKSQRHSGKFKDKTREISTDNAETYDWVVDIDFITKVAREGWDIKFSKDFLEKSNLNIQRHVLGDLSNNTNELIYSTPNKNNKDNLSQPTSPIQNISWDGAIVAVVGLYDKGKTFVLNNLSFSD